MTVCLYVPSETEKNAYFRDFALSPLIELADFGGDAHHLVHLPNVRL